ncbi:conserved hypothetical protein [Tenacibaculum sp. 190524A02b]|uniref:Uncharacterized protein n=1 Tax=Tenacibaculum vairaonense TaxID=3137860 RepID=A0ABP1FFK9_9FLAO
MKKISITLLFLLLGLVVKAQEDISLFRLLSANYHEGLPYLNHDIETDEASLEPNLAIKYQLNTGYLGTFIIIPKGKGSVLIESLKKRGYFLKYDKGSSKSLRFEKLDNKNKLPRLNENTNSTYLFNLNYAGSVSSRASQSSLNPFRHVYITPAGSGTELAFSNEDGKLEVKSVTDEDGKRTSTSSPAKLASKFIFHLQRIKNVL